MAVYQCTRCGFWSRSRDAVIEHLWGVHRQEGPISIDDFAFRPEPSYRPMAPELRFRTAYRREASGLPRF